MPLDPEKRRAIKKRYRDRQIAMKYGAEAVGQDMRGRHGNHSKGPNNARWSGDRRMTSHGYIAVRVPPDHPHAWGPPSLKRFKYAYEHVLTMMAHLGRPLERGEVVHHRNGDKTDNRIENLELLTMSEHQRLHALETRQRDTIGRFI